MKNNGHYAVQSHSKSPISPVCDFLLVNNSKLTYYILLAPFPLFPRSWINPRQNVDVDRWVCLLCLTQSSVTNP